MNYNKFIELQGELVNTIENNSYHRITDVSAFISDFGKFI